MKRIAESHIRVDIEDKPMILSYCDIHKESRAELYCLQCKIALCVYCKIEGSHSMNASNNKHVLKKIENAYNDARL